MKWRFTLCFLFLGLYLKGQTISEKIDSIKPQAKIVVGCRGTTSIPTNCQPLYIIDGIPQEPTEKPLEKIDVSTIERIDVLKDAEATALYGARATYGVILITTRNYKFRVFQVIDSTDTQPVSSATVTFIPERNPADSLMFITDEFGQIRTENLKRSTTYSVKISSIGYGTKLNMYTNRNAEQTTFAISRKFVENTPVTVIGYSATKCVWSKGCCCGTLIRMSCYNEIMKTGQSVPGFKFYPNPVIRGAEIKIEWNNENTSTVQARIMSLDGRLLQTKSYSVFEGKNLLSLNTESRWTSGTYFVQLFDPSGKLIKQEKVLIQ